MKVVLMLLIFVTMAAKSVELTQKNLARVIVALKIENKELAFKQAMLESGNLKSKLCTVGNNIYGFRASKNGFNEGMIYGYAKYRCWQLSVIEYAIHVKKHGLRDYAKDVNYKKKLKGIRIKKEIKRLLNRANDR